MTDACLIFLGLILLATGAIQLTKAQYEKGASYHVPAHHPYPIQNYGHHPDEHYEDDERPKVRLGIRLRIPAMKIDLPRFNMPKITVSAKIRQPDGPRVINLPEINLDTTSKVESPSTMHHPHQPQSYPVYNYNSGHQHHPYHHQGSENVQQYSFSAQSYQQPTWSHNYNHQPQAKHGQHHYSQGPMVIAGPPSSYPNGQTQYQPWDRPASTGIGAYGTTSAQENFRSSQETDVGFDEPVQQSPSQRSKRFIKEGISQARGLSVLKKLMRIK